jgi:hypothetical protein
MEEARTIAVAGCKQGLEDRPEIDTPENEKEEHGDVLEGMYTADIHDAKGQPVLGRASMTTEQAEGLRKIRRAICQGTAGGVW